MNKKFLAGEQFSSQAYINSQEKYEEMYKESLNDPDGFWGKIAEEFVWSKKWDSVLSEEDFKEGKVKWFEGGELNITVNCLDRHLEDKGDKVAYIWEANNPPLEDLEGAGRAEGAEGAGRAEGAEGTEGQGSVVRFTYKQAYEQVCKYGNFLRDFGVKKGDRVCFYVPMVPEAIFLLLACARIGAIHNVIFGGYSGNSIQERVEDCKARFVITANEGLRGEKKIPLKKTVDEALSEGCDSVEKVLVIRGTDSKTEMQEGRDVWLDEVVKSEYEGVCEPEVMKAEDPLFILYTSGSTGKPKGVLHTCGGYMVYAATTLKYAFDVKDDDIFWCTADIGWVTGHSYIIYGPLLSGTTSVIFEGVLTYPDAGRSWDMVERHKVSIFYTAPTLIRVLQKAGDDFPNGKDLSSLRLLGSVGEPINPDPWLWYYRAIGKEQCPIVDTYWQTETGGFVIMPFPAAYPIKPGSAGRPFFGIEPILLDNEGKEISENGVNGRLMIKRSWPGMMRGVYGDSSKFKEKYFSHFPGYYETGDGGRRDEDGDFWISGRIDDVLTVAGHRLGTAEIENALVSHEAVAEAAVVGVPDEVKGEAIYAYVVLSGLHESNGLYGSEDELKDYVAEEIGHVAKPSVVRIVSGLPKTRSGKIMRRILKKIARGESESLGDMSALANPEVLEELV